MREFSLDARAKPHPQTIVARFGSWNGAKRRAGLVARRFATREELLLQLRELGAELGRTPTGADLDAEAALDAVEVALLADVRLVLDPRSARPASTFPGRRSAPSARWRKAFASRRGFAGCRASRTGRGSGLATRGSPANGRSTGSSAGARAPGRPSCGRWSGGSLAGSRASRGGRGQRSQEREAGAMLLGRAHGGEELLGEGHVGLGRTRSGRLGRRSRREACPRRPRG